MSDWIGSAMPIVTGEPALASVAAIENTPGISCALEQLLSTVSQAVPALASTWLIRSVEK